MTDIESKKGIYYDFAKLFNRAQSEFYLNVKFVPRKRIDRMLDNNNLDGIIMGVNPIWFGDKDKTKFLWSEFIMEDMDVFVSNSTIPVKVNNFSDLTHKRVGGIHGFRYFGIDELAQQKRLTRINTQSETQLLDMVEKKRIDTAIISIFTLSFLSKGRSELFYVAEKEHDKFTRHFLIPSKQQTPLLKQLNDALINPGFNKKWQQVLSQYTIEK